MFNQILKMWFLLLKYRARDLNRLLCLLVLLASTAFQQGIAQSSGMPKDTINPMPIDTIVQVVGIDLINAETQEVIRTLIDDDVIYLQNYDFSLDFKARLDAELDSIDVEASVIFDLKSNNLVLRAKKYAPFVLIGSNPPVDFFGFRPGEYHLAVSPSLTQPNGAAIQGIPLLLNFSIVEDSLPPPPPPVDSSLLSVDRVDLVNAATQEVIKTLENQDVINLADYDFDLDLIARLSGGDMDSSALRACVVFDLKGDNLVLQAKRQSPFVLIGSNPPVDFFGFRPGEYHLAVTPSLTQPNGAAIQGIPLSLNFSIVEDSLPPPPPPVDSSLLSVDRVDLVNAATQEVIKTLENQDVINLADYDFDLDLIARLSGGDMDSSALRACVVFDLKGDNLVLQAKRQSPFVLIGSNPPVDFFGFRPGEYHLAVTPSLTQPNGAAIQGIPLSLNFSIVEDSLPPPPPPVDSSLLSVDRVDLVNAATQEVIKTLENQDVINLADYDFDLDLIARLSGGDMDSSALRACVVFDLKGDNLVLQAKRQSPFVLIGSNPPVDFFGFRPGEYHLAVSPSLTQPNGAAIQGIPLSLNFSIVEDSLPPPPPPVDSSLLFVDRVDLVNADTDEVIKVLESGDVINLADYNTALDLVAHVDSYGDSSAFAGSVRFELLGSDSSYVNEVDSIAPYVLGGGFSFSEGAYSLRVTPYGSQDAAPHTAGLPLFIEFSVVDSLLPPPPPDSMVYSEVDLKLYPNETEGPLNIQVEFSDDEQAVLEIYDVKGNLLKSIKVNQEGTLSLDVRSLGGGGSKMLFVRLLSGQRAITKRLFLR